MVKGLPDDFWRRARVSIRLCSETRPVDAAAIFQWNVVAIVCHPSVTQPPKVERKERPTKDQQLV
ncbi:Uncharacterized protein APZ42_007997, partial [Daphnia magna]